MPATPWANPDYEDNAVLGPADPLQPDEEPAVDEYRQRYVDGLRELADYIETTDLDVDEIDFNPVRIDLFGWTKEQFDEKARLLGGSREKVLQGSYAITHRNFGPHRIDVNISREKVCEKVQTGTRVVLAQEAVEEHEEPVYEWRCEGFEVLA